MRPPRDPMLLAAEAALADMIDPLLRAHRFARAAPPVVLARERWYVGGYWTRPGLKGRPQFVVVELSMDPRDEPFYVSAFLGEGNATAFFDREFRGVPLWRLLEVRRPGRRATYAVNSADDVRRVIGEIAGDLSDVAGDFLKGDLSGYRELRPSLPPFPKATLTLSLAAQLLTLPWRTVMWTLRGGPRRLRAALRELPPGDRDE